MRQVKLPNLANPEPDPRRCAVPDIDRLLLALGANGPATEAGVAAAEAALGAPLPGHYRDFLRRADGGEGPLGSGYLALWTVAELSELNRSYSVDELVPGLLLVGSDGGNTGYALDLRADAAPVVSVPFVPMDHRLVEPIGDTIVDLLTAIESG